MSEIVFGITDQRGAEITSRFLCKIAFAEFWNNHEVVTPAWITLVEEEVNSYSGSERDFCSYMCGKIEAAMGTDDVPVAELLVIKEESGAETWEELFSYLERKVNFKEITKTNNENKN